MIERHPDKEPSGTMTVTKIRGKILSLYEVFDMEVVDEFTCLKGPFIVNPLRIQKYPLRVQLYRFSTLFWGAVTFSVVIVELR